MVLAFGFKAHSGWAALVALGAAGRDLVVTDRHRVELADLTGGAWARQPYHAAEGLPAARARKVVLDGVETAQRLARSEIEAALTRAKLQGHTVVGCGVLIGSPMPDWTVEEILAVHFRMHHAEGVLYRDVLIEAARACKLRVVEIPEKRVSEEAQRLLRRPASALMQTVSGLKAQVGAPWGKDQKEAALAAMIALKC